MIPIQHLLPDCQIGATLQDVTISAITQDSRAVTPGCAFVCIQGRHFDGHARAVYALQQGAAVVVTQRDLGLAKQIVVADTEKTYAHMCAAFFGHPARELTMVAVTGTNGKTSVCYCLREILQAAGHKTGLIGTAGVQIGQQQEASALTTPDPFHLHRLLRDMVDSGCTHCVMEASSQALAAGAKPRSGYTLCGCGFHQPHAGPPGLPRQHGGLPCGKAAVICAGGCWHRQP